jgi:SAM-dependent methyltransferase
MVANKCFSLINQALQDNYDTYYVDGESEWRKLGAKHKVNNIISMCSSVRHTRILDIGAGEGAVSAELSRREFCSEITCLEISKSGVDVIRNRQLPSIKEAKTFDGYRIPYADNNFDLAIASHVLEHVEHQRLFIYEAMRVAEHLFIEVPLEDTLRLPRNYKPDRVGHLNFYNYKTVRRLLQSCGLEVLDQRLFDTPLDVHTFSGKMKGTIKFIIRRAADTLSHQLSGRLFTYYCGILCSKQ